MLSDKAAVLAGLYRRGRVTLAGLAQAVADGVITAAEYTSVSGQAYTGQEEAAAE